MTKRKEGLAGIRLEVPERHDLEMDKNILRDIVFAQAGTREKAVLEGVMNSADAGCTRITIEIDEKHLVIDDDGRGFQTKDEILRHFKTFGTPHKPGDAKFGRFRMGRGQLFAKGVNVWRSGPFRMRVDAKKELAFDLEQDLGSHKGCRIEVDWYDRLHTAERMQIVREIERMVLYMDVPISINGNVVSKPPKDEKWDDETPEAYFRFTRSGTLSTYNLGIFVNDVSSSVHGVGGVVVSKQQLKVNFARNDVMQSECAVWKKIMKVVRKRAERTIRDKSGTNGTSRKELTDAERERIALSLMAGELDAKLHPENLRLFADVTGAWRSLTEVLRWMKKHNVTTATVAKEGDQKGDVLMQQHRAFVFARETFAKFGVRSLEELRQKWDCESQWKVQHKNPLRTMYYQFALRLDALKNVVPFLRLSSTVNLKMTSLADHQVSKLTQLVLRVVRDSQEVALRHMDSDGGARPKMRQVVAGESRSAIGWTDGASFVALERQLFFGCGDMNVASWLRIGHTLIHEYCHDDSTMDGHLHTPDFYKRYHEASREALGAFVHECVWRYAQEMEKLGRALSKESWQLMDRLDRSHELGDLIDKIDAALVRHQQQKRGLAAEV